MGEIEERLRQRGIVLPAVFEGRSPRAVVFDRVRVAGDVAYVSAHGPMDGSRALIKGKVGDHRAGDWLSQEVGYEAARMAALSVLASLSAQLGTLDRVSGWLKVLGFVSVAPGFTGASFVMNGFSDVILDLWEERGRHASSAVGVAELPFGVPVAVEAVLTLS
jgi:enamine deaminase RidA (YjgF/YER057c/UK114 family)